MARFDTAFDATGIDPTTGYDVLPAGKYRAAEAQLLALGALDETGALTPKGREMARLPMPNTSLKITTARYYTPSGQSIQAKGILPDIPVDETAEGSPYAALRLREADLDKHLVNGPEADKKDVAREKAREEALKKLEEANAKAKEARDKNKPVSVLPEYGAPDDFPLQQALNRLKGKPVVASKTQVERKADEPKPN